jgi:hypothetical protein
VLFYFLDVVLDENGEVASAFVGLEEKVEVASAIGLWAGHYYYDGCSFFDVIMCSVLYAAL